MSDDERDWRAPDAKRMSFDEMAARAQYEWDRAEKAEAEAANYSARIEALEAENARLVEWKQNQEVHWPSEIERRNRDLAAAESRADAAESALARLQDNVCASFDKWSKVLGWGLIGVQPECWALMDAAVEELVSKRSALAEAVEVLRPFTRYDAVAMTVSSYADYAVHVKSSIDDQPHYKHFAAARAFVQQHEGKK